MAAPTYTHKTAAPTPGPENNLGGQVVDGNRVAVQGLASGFVTTDISGSAITSPVTLSTSVTTLTSPVSATRLILTNTDATNNVLVSELVGMTTYAVIKPGQTLSLDIGRQGTVYIKGSASTPVCSFLYQLVD